MPDVASIPDVINRYTAADFQHSATCNFLDAPHLVTYIYCTLLALRSTKVDDQV